MKPHGHRSFYHVLESPASSESGFVEDSQTLNLKAAKKLRSKTSLFRGNGRDLIQMIETNIIGREIVFQGPFGPRRTIYVDHTASGQSLRCIEDFVLHHVLPYYANTHTTGTLTSAQTTMYRHEARDIVRNAVGASEHDVVIFCGSGATGPVHKLINALTSDPSKPPPVVFIGPFEHHSNMLPWRDVGAKVITIPVTVYGEFDVGFLEERLKEAANEGIKNRLMIGSFSVASNVTGICTDDVAVTILLHRYGALSLWDYSAAAPHAQVVMNPIVISENEQGLAKKDALFFSGHKFVGGPQTPGVLIAKNSLFGNHCPHGGGGGSVFFVTENSHRYLKNTEYREEGGTPAIVESIRLGLVFKLKETVGSQNIISREAGFVKKILDDWSKVPEIHILGSITHPRIPIISFLIEHPDSGYYLHHNYVVVLLNDLFGIQARGGCACAGPYSMSLLGIDLQLAHEYESLLLDDSRLDREHLRRRSEGSAYELFRPGFTRLSIPYYSSVQEAEFVSEAVQLVAKHGWKLLPLYTCNPETGEFHHHLNPTLQHRKWLSWATFNSEGIRCKERTRNNSEDSANYSECLEQAKNIFSNASSLCKRRSLSNQSLIFDSAVAHLKWFLLPSESLILNNSSVSIASATSGSQLVKSSRPFRIKTCISSNKQPDSLNYCRYSIPYQIMQSTTWSSSDLTNENVSYQLHRNFGDSGSIENSNWDSLNNSSIDSDNEFLVPGSTVTGPSICFSGTNVINTENSFAFESPPMFRNQLTQVDRENNNTANSHASVESNVSFNYPSQPCANSYDSQDYSTPSKFVNENSMLNFLTQSPHAASPDGDALLHCRTDFIDDHAVTTSNNYAQGSSYEGIQPESNQFSFSHQGTSICESPVSLSSKPGYVEGLDTSLMNMNLNLGSNGCVPQNDQNVSYNNITVTTPGQGFCDFPQNPEQTLHIINDTKSPELNCGHYVLPSSSPLYYQRQQQNFHANINLQQDVTGPPSGPVFNLTSVSPVPYYNSANVSPGPSSPVFHDEFVNMAMRRVTDEIANELKSEIREVITQVEQGMDPDGARERANSFNSKDKRLQRFKRRERTLSGQVLNGNFKKNESEESALATIARSKTIDAIWNSVDTSKPVGYTPSEARDLPIEKVQRKSFGGTKWHCPPKNIIKPTLEALTDFPMIQDGDRLLVCLSGGKDSLSLLHTIKQVQYVLAKKGISFTFGAVTVDPGSSAYNPKPLIPYLEALGVPYYFEQQGIMPTALEKGPENISSICSFCSRLKRGRIYLTARENSYNVLALGQHLDDLAESFFMSVFHNGLLRTMKACYTVKEGDLRVIRPFINVREKSLRDFAESRGLPIIPENCPACFDAPTERHRVKQLLAQQEILFPKIYLSLRSAMHPLLAINKTGMESSSKNRSRKQSSISDSCDDIEEQFCK